MYMFSLKIEDVAKFKKIAAFMKSFNNECVISVDRFGMKVRAATESNTFQFDAVVHELTVEGKHEITLDTEQLHKVVNSIVGVYEIRYDKVGELMIQNSWSDYCIKLIDLEEVIPEIPSDIIYDNVQMLDSDRVIMCIKSATDFGDTFTFRSDMRLDVVGQYCSSEVFLKMEVEPKTDTSVELTKKQLTFISKLSKFNKKISFSISENQPMRIIVVSDTMGVLSLFLN